MNTSYTIRDFQDLTEPQQAFLGAVHDDAKLRKTFFFTGGTLLKARGIVPRFSNDIDLFTFPTVLPRDYLAALQAIHGLLNNLFNEVNVKETERGFLHAPSGMVIEAVHDTTSPIDEFVLFSTLSTSGLQDLAAHKASALCSRDEVKDYIDIAFLTHRHGWYLRDLELFAEKKFRLGTIREEHLMTELLAKREALIVPPNIFLRDQDRNVAFVAEQVQRLLNNTTL